MKRFSNLNVLGLLGVSIDAGEAPYIVMPYMANGSLLAYLKKERVNLTIAVGASEEVVSCCHKLHIALQRHPMSPKSDLVYLVQTSIPVNCCENKISDLKNELSTLVFLPVMDQTFQSIHGSVGNQYILISCDLSYCSHILFHDCRLWMHREPSCPCVCR